MPNDGQEQSECLKTGTYKEQTAVAFLMAALLTVWMAWLDACIRLTGPAVPCSTTAETGRTNLTGRSTCRM